MSLNQINQLLPKKSTFKLKSLDIEIGLKPCTPRLILELFNYYQKGLDDLLSMPSAENLSKICMVLMDEENKKLFAKKTYKTITPDGDEIEKTEGGYLLLMDAISSIDEQFYIYKAILISVGLDETSANETMEKYKAALQNIVSDGIKAIEENNKTNGDELKKNT